MGFTKLRLNRGTFDHVTLSSDTTISQSEIIYSNDWDSNTILNANFNGTLKAGTVNVPLSQITSCELKRKKADEYEWITLYKKSVVSSNPFSISFNDITAKANEDYVYALVIMTQSVEREYITSEITTNMRFVYLSDIDNSYKLYGEVVYGSTESVQSTSIYEPIGSKYPIIVSNASTDYEKGTVSALILNDDFLNSRQIDKFKIVELKNEFEAFLKNKKSKILKDNNGNIWAVMITGNPSINYDSNYGNGVITVNFNWTEQGDAESGSDLYSLGIISASN